MKDLNESVRDEIDVILRHAQKALTTGDKQSAAKLAAEAWSKLPDPKFGWDVSKSFAHAVAELYRDTGNFSAALKVMNNLFLSGQSNHTKMAHILYWGLSTLNLAIWRTQKNHS